MGNRAVITTEPYVENNIGVYVHWNGGHDSINAFLTYCKLRGFRPPEQDNYGWAGLTQIIANYFGKEGLSIGIDKCSELDVDNGDNGAYLIRDWNIIGRKHHDGPEQKNYKLEQMLIDIDDEQPTSQQLGKEKIIELLKNLNTKS